MLALRMEREKLKLRREIVETKSDLIETKSDLVSAISQFFFSVRDVLTFKAVISTSVANLILHPPHIRPFLG